MKKVLIVTYYWPPAGGPGIQRVLKIVKRLPEHGWHPIILTVKNGDYPAIDESLLKEIPPECKVYRTDLLEPYGLYRKLTGKKQDEKIPTFVLNPQKEDTAKDKIAKWVRAKLFIPDARIGWIPYAVKEGMKAIREEKVDLIYSTSPPQTVQLIAKKLAKKSGLPWVADFRDPWTEAFWAAELQQEGLVKRINRSMERGVLKKASIVTTVSEGLVKMFAAKAPDTRYEIIQNGFEEINQSAEKTDRFAILFFGHLNKYQHWEPLLKAIEMLPDDITSQIDVVFIGKRFAGFESAAGKYAKTNLVLYDYLPYDKMIATAGKASLLFRPMAKMAYTASGIGAKTYDYLSLRKPILTIGPKPSVMEKILKETESGEIFDQAEITNIANFIEAHFQKWQKNDCLLLPDSDKLNAYRTGYNVQKLVSLFKEVCPDR